MSAVETEKQVENMEIIAEDNPETAVISTGTHVVEGQQVFVRKEGKDGSTKLLTIKKNVKLRFGKLAFTLNNAIGQRFGKTYEVQGEDLVMCEGMEDVHLLDSDEQPTRDNRQIIDDSAKQVLSRDDIEKLKSDGVHGEEIIKQLVANSDSFQQRTEFSQAKYLARKQSKYLNFITILPVTSRGLSELMLEKGAQKILNLRVDSLAGLLTQANIRPGSRVLVADTVQGMVVGAVLERLGGMGECMQLHVGDLPPTQLIEPFNHSPEIMSVLKTFPLDSIHLAQKKADETEHDTEMEELKAKKEAYDPSLGPWDSVWEKRILKRQSTRVARHSAALSLLQGNFDALIIATKFQPHVILANLLPLLNLSRPFAVYYPYKECLVEAFHTAKDTGCIRVQLYETWTREYQILPSRSHPMNSMNANSGFILSGIKVAANEKEAVMPPSNEKKSSGKRKFNNRS